MGLKAEAEEAIWSAGPRATEGGRWTEANVAQARALGHRARALALDLVNEMGRSVSMQRKQASTGGRGWTGEGALDPGDDRM